MSEVQFAALETVDRACELRRTAELERMRSIAAARSAGLSLRAIAEVAGVSTQRVHQMLAGTR